MNIIHRTFKMTLATTVAVLIAQLLSLSNAYAAGIIAILSLLDTRTDTFKMAISRVTSTFTAFILALFLFNFLGFNVWSFAIFLLLYIPICYQLGIQAGIAPSSVLVTYFIAAQSTSLNHVINGLVLMLLGTGSALLINLWMPSQSKNLLNLKNQIDEQIMYVLVMMHDSLKAPHCDVRVIQHHVKEIEAMIQQAQGLALNEYKNAIFQRNEYTINYLNMRSTQLTILSGLVDLLPNIPLAIEQGNALAELLAITANEYGEHNTGMELLEGVADLYRYYRQTQLPITREEFESRAMIYAFLVDFNRFLEVKRDFYPQNTTKIMRE